jgi:hypothetical protein
MGQPIRVQQLRQPGSTVALMTATVRLCSATGDRVRFALVVIAFVIDHAQDIVQVADFNPTNLILGSIRPLLRMTNRTHVQAAF